MKAIAAALVAVTLSMPLAAQNPAAEQDPSKAFMLQFDANKDASVSLDEFKAPQVETLERQFAYIDKNQDGNIDQDEIAQFTREMDQRMQQMRQQ